MSNGPPMDAEEVAAAVAQVISRGSKITDVMIGLAAFLGGLIMTAYPHAVRKQTVVTFANATWDMMQARMVEKGMVDAEEETPPEPVIKPVTMQ